MRLLPGHSAQHRRLLGAGACVLLALLAALATTRSITVLPPQIAPRSLQVAGASTHVVVDLPQPEIGDAKVQSQDLDALWRQATLLADLLTSDPALEDLGRHAGIDPRQIAGTTRITANVPTVMTEPDSERRAAQIVAERKPYRIEVEPSFNLPTFNVYTEAPSVPEAESLARAVVPALNEYMRALARQKGYDASRLARLTPVGAVRSTVLSTGSKMTAALTFLLVLSVSGTLLAVATRRRSRRGPPRPIDDAPSGTGPDFGPPHEPAGELRARARFAPTGGGVPVPAGYASALVATPPGSIGFPRVPAATLPLRRAAVQARATSRRLASGAGDWPRTTRVLPWMIAAMLVLIWLVPFDSIMLRASLPLDLKLDRLMLPFIVGTWVLALAAGGPTAPRLRWTPIHVALGVILAIACVSLIVNAGYLSRTLELQTGVKKLTLLASYISLFVVAASTVRPTEVPAFMKYTLWLAVICALGTIWEYRFHYNIFYSLPQKVLPGVFSVDDVAESAAVDDLGRRLVRGPGGIPLECVAMLVMAMPIAFVGVMQAKDRRGRILYGLAACLLLAAMLSTYRKSAVIGPIAVILTLAYFRRRELLRLAPLGLVLLVGIHVISPGAFGAILFQLRGDRLGVNTVSDRTSDYDAIRPDVLSHLALGRGYGTYEHTLYRILDMELLHEVVEVGVLGLSAYIMAILAVVALARAPIRQRGTMAAPVALTVAAAAVAFLVVSTLFDAMSFPHCPYIFLWLAALLVAVTSPARSREPARSPPWSS